MLTTVATPPTIPDDTPLLIDCLTAARMLGISSRLLWTLTQRGEVSCRRIGRRVLYSRSALERYADAGRAQP
jgi:hypothetical protein